MDEAQVNNRPTCLHKPPAYLRDYQTQFPCSQLSESHPLPQPSHTIPQSLKSMHESSAGKTAAAWNKPVPPSKPANAAEDKTSSTDRQVMRREIDQFKNLILRVGQSVQALGDRLDTQSDSDASIYSQSLPALDDDDESDHSPGSCSPQNHPPIVKELHQKLCEHNIPISHCVTQPPAPPAPSRLCSLPPPPSS